jgi:hypothetical protein
MTMFVIENVKTGCIVQYKHEEKTILTFLKSIYPYLDVKIDDFSLRQKQMDFTEKTRNHQRVSGNERT